MILLLAACSENELVKTGDDPTGATATAAPAIQVSPPEVDFGELQVTDEGVATLTLQNVGDDTLILDDLSLVGGTVDLTWTNVSTPAIAPGGSVDTVLTWAPVSGQPLADTLRIASNDPDDPFVDVPLSGTLPAPDIRITPATHDFGDLEVGLSALTTFHVENVGAGPLHVSNLTWAATDTDLQLVDAGALTALPATLDPGASTDLTITYAPTAAGADEGSFEIFSDDPDTPGNGGSVFGNGTAVDPCDGYSQTVSLMLTADDAWQAWIDGTSFTGPGANAWSSIDTFEWELPCGDHTLAIYATDTAHAISGVIAVVKVEGVTRFVSGVDNWTIADAPPSADWTEITYDDSSWKVPEVCADYSLWGSTPDPFYREGADWIWWTSTCTDLGEAWFRLNFTVP